MGREALPRTEERRPGAGMTGHSARHPRPALPRRPRHRPRDAQVRPTPASLSARPPRHGRDGAGRTDPPRSASDGRRVLGGRVLRRHTRGPGSCCQGRGSPCPTEAPLPESRLQSWRGVGLAGVAVRAERTQSAGAGGRRGSQARPVGRTAACPWSWPARVLAVWAGRARVPADAEAHSCFPCFVPRSEGVLPACLSGPGADRGVCARSA